MNDYENPLYDKVDRFCFSCFYWQNCLKYRGKDEKIYRQNACARMMKGQECNYLNDEIAMEKGFYKQ